MKFKRADLYQMVSMSWTDYAVPSKGTVGPGTRKFVDDYLDRGLAGRTNYEAVRSWAETRVRIGEFVAGRRDRAGRLTSIVLDGIRHRLKSIARIIKTQSKEPVPMEIERACGTSATEVRSKDAAPISVTAGPSLADFPRLQSFVRKAKQKKRLRKRSGLPAL